jgi:hypothetical protein
MVRSDNKSNLNHKCPGCDRPFATKAGMIQHLEAGTCKSGCDAYTIDHLAIIFPLSEHYTRTQVAGIEFICPICQLGFYDMSALLRHAESSRCKEAVSSESPLGAFVNSLSLQDIKLGKVHCGVS